MRGSTSEARGFKRRRMRLPHLSTKPFQLLLAGMLLASMFAAAAPQAARADSYDHIATDELNLRDGPGTWANVIDHMWNGELITVLDGPTGDNWYYVDYYGEVGWAYGGYLSINGVDGAEADGVGSSAAPEPEHWIDIDRGGGTVTLYIGDTPVNSFYAVMSRDQSAGGFYATAIGTYHVFSKYRGLSWTEWGQTFIEDWVGFDPERDNGFHSYSMDGGGNVLPDGDALTGGCVATEPSDARVIYDFAQLGMRVRVHW
jgi:hypothetical protein